MTVFVVNVLALEVTRCCVCIVLCVCSACLRSVSVCSACVDCNCVCSDCVCGTCECSACVGCNCSGHRILARHTLQQILNVLSE